MTLPPGTTYTEILPSAPIGTIAKLALVEPAPGTLSVDELPYAPRRYGTACTYPPFNESVEVRLIATAVASPGTPTEVIPTSTMPNSGCGPLVRPTRLVGRVSTMRVGCTW